MRTKRVRHRAQKGDKKYIQNSDGNLLESKDLED